MFRLCRARSSGSVGTRCRDRNTCEMDQTICHRIHRHTDRNGIKTAGGSVRYDVLFREDHGQRTRPVLFSQFPARLRDLLHDRRKFFHTGNMGDQRVVGRTSFCRVDLLCRFLIQRVGTKAVNGLRRERHETAVFQDLSRL